MRAFIICVDFADVLSITLPYNRHHFDKVAVITKPDDYDTLSVAVDNEAETFITDAFYRKKAIFNKWLALEEGLDHFGRKDWICLLDADVLWPRKAKLPELTPGTLYGPPRRICDPIPKKPPAEKHWTTYPIQRNSLREFPGFTQIFHADDPRLGNQPWHETNWKHAGRADSFFQQKWPKEHKQRLDFDVLHLGKNGEDWCGRTKPHLDGRIPNESQWRAECMHTLRTGRPDPSKGRWDHEKLEDE